MEASIRLSEEDYLKARALWHRLHSRMTREGRFAFAGFCLLLALYGLFTGMKGWSPFGMLLAAGLVLLPMLLLPWRWRRTYRRYLMPQYPMRVRLDETGVVINGAHGLDWQGGWNELSGWVIVDDFLFLLNQGQKVVSILPIAQFDAEEGAVRGLLEQHLQCYLEQR